MGRNDKIASASPAFPAQNLILNDENWEAFLFTIQTDGQEAEQAASGYQSLLEAVGSGIRQKFTVISRPSLFSWAAENTKLYDVCKEAKALLDAGTPEGDIPNYVVARLLKARLITLKQDGIEARNATKAAKENPDPAPISPESGDKSKPVKKDDKEKDKEKEKEKEKEREKEKDKERAKSSPKKIAKGAPPPKQPEVVSRPSSGGASADQSKRKNKLRDRGVVRHEAKPTSIDDEPETGPDAYYLLKNFGNATFFSSLVDDAALPLNLVLRLTCAQCAESQPSQEEASQPATFTWRTTSDPFFASMRQAMHSSTDTSLWKHCTFRDLTLEEGRDAKELFDTVARAIYLILEKRKIYADFYSNDAIITIPDVDDLKLLENLRYFRSLVRASPCEKFLDVDLLCGILLEQVTRSNAAEDENEKSLLVESTRTEEIALLKQYFEAATSKLLIPKHTGSRTRLDHQTDANKNGSAEVFTAQATDVHAYLARRVGRLSSLGIEASAIIEQVSSVYRVRRYLDNMKRLVDQGAMEVPSLASRKLLGSTYTSQVSTDLDEDDMKRFLLFLDLETFLAPKSQDGTGMDLSEWRWEEDFDSHTFIQVLQKCRSVYPEIHAKFSEKEAALFLVMAGPGQLGAPEGQTDFEYQAKTRVMFGLFSELYDDKRHYLEQPPTSEKEDSSYSYVYSAGNQIMHFRETSKYMYPNACAYIQDRKLAFMDQTNERTITLQSDQFSINWRGPNSTRGEPYLTASFSNGTVFSVTKSTTNEGYSIQASTADGLTVEWDPHGRVYQRLLCPSYTFGSPAANDAASNTEIGRLILNEGVVVKYFFGTETEVLFPNGNVSRQSHDGSWTSTNGEGDKLSTSQDGHEVQSTLKSIREKDLTFNFTNVTREDMVTVKTEDNGTLTAEHADGTTIVTHGHQSDTAGIKNVPDSIIVKSREHAIVTTKPSLGTVIVELPDKTIIERSKGSSPDDGTIFRISQAGKWLEVDLQGTATFRNVNYSETPVGPETGSHRIGWLDGSLTVVDWDDNVFKITNDGEHHIHRTPQSQSVEEDSEESAGSIVDRIKQKRLLRRPLQIAGNVPQLFILREDGSGTALRRDIDVMEILFDELDKSNTRVVEETIQESHGAVCLTVLRTKDEDEERNAESCRGGSIIIYRQLVRNPRVTAQIREMALRDVQFLRNWAASKERETASFSMFEKLNEQAEAVSKELSSRDSNMSEPKNGRCVYGRDRAATEQAIRQKFMLSESQLIETRAGAAATRGATGLVPASSAKPQLLTVKEAKTSTVPARRRKSFVHSLRQGSNIPRYFKSFEEGGMTLEPYSPKIPMHSREDDNISRAKNETPPANHFQTTDNAAKPTKPLTTQTEQQSKNGVPDSDIQETKRRQADDHPKRSVLFHLRKTDDVVRDRNPKAHTPSIPRPPKSGVEPNTQYLAVEAHARRQINTASTAKKSQNDEFPSIGSFLVRPTKINFGTLSPGDTAHCSISLINIGNDSARFKVKHKKDTLLSSKYKPGPVAPGIKQELNLLFSPLAETKDGVVRDQFQIVTESEILTVTCRANIIAAL